MIKQQNLYMLNCALNYMLIDRYKCIFMQIILPAQVITNLNLNLASISYFGSVCLSVCMYVCMYDDKSKRIYAQNITELSKPIGPRIINKKVPRRILNRQFRLIASSARCHTGTFSARRCGAWFSTRQGCQEQDLKNIPGALLCFSITSCSTTTCPPPQLAATVKSKPAPCRVIV